jgi:ribonuclease HII
LIKSRKTLKKSERGLLSPEADRVLISELFSGEYDYCVGIDEVGVACLAGPVVSACYAYPLKSETQDWTRQSVPVVIFDSKNLSQTEKEQSESWLISREKCYWAFGEASVKEIDEINIYHATSLAMVRAFQGVYSKILALHNGETPRIAIMIDGNRIPPALGAYSPQVESRFIVKGDTKSFAVASASILAKLNRDRFMASLSEKPEFGVYGWVSNVGYPTPSHKKAIKEHGRTLWHRESFNCS